MLLEVDWLSSAPILQFQGLVDPEKFSEIITDDYTKSSPKCTQNIRTALQLISTINSKDGYQRLTHSFSLCSPINNVNDVNNLLGWIGNALSYVAMTDYPYSTNFLRKLPPWPVEATCRALLPYSDILIGLAKGMGVFYNTTGDQKCFNISENISPGLGDAVWNYQACTEMVLPISSNGVNDFFLPSPWDLNGYIQGCKEAFNVNTRPFWIQLQFGGKNITSSSNIIFSNGELDPWRAGGVNKSLSSSLIAIYIAKGAHHLDLRTPHPEDPQSVIAARITETNIISQWLQQ